MRMQQWYDPVHCETVLQVAFSDLDLAKAPLDVIDKWIINSRKEYTIADTLQNAQLIAFRIEQQEARHAV